MAAPIDKSKAQNKYHGFIFSSSDFIILYNVKNNDIDKIKIIIPIVVFAAIVKLFYVKHKTAVQPSLPFTPPKNKNKKTRQDFRTENQNYLRAGHPPPLAFAAIGTLLFVQESAAPFFLLRSFFQIFPLEYSGK